MDNSVECYEVSRLQTFSDAVCSIVATILILPLRNINESSSPDFVPYLEDRENFLIVYFISFLLICSVWESHIMRWMVIAHVDDVLVWLNITSLLFVSFLPFAVRLVGEYTHKETPIVLSCGLLLVLEAIEIAMVWYTFSQQNLLRGDLRNALPFELRQKRNYILKRKLLNPVLYIAAAALSFVNVIISWVLILFVIISPCINRLFEVIIYRMRFVSEDQHVFLYQNIICKDRMECFTDGVYAIVATLLVLDITSDKFPKKTDVIKQGLDNVLSKMWADYATYVGTFALCGILWFVHHSLLCSIRKVNYVMLIINNISLSCIGSFPFLVSILNKYVKGAEDTNSHAIQFGSLIVGTAGLCQFAMFAVALLNSQQYIYQQIVPVGAGSLRHNYLLIKLLLIPIIAIIIFCCTFSTSFVAFVTYHTLVLATPLIFILVKFIYFKVFTRQVVMMNPIHNDQGAWSNREIVSSQVNPAAGGTFSPSYDEYNSGR